MEFLGSRFVGLLAIAVPVYWALPRGSIHRTVFLSLLSVAFIALWHPVFAAVALGTALGVRAACDRGPRPFWWAVLGCVALLVGVKEWPGWLPEGTWAERHLVAPLGVSYFVFRLIGYAAARRRGLAGPASAPDLLAYLLFFPTYAAGPIETYGDFFGRRTERPDGALFAWGCGRLILGYFKKLFLLGWLFPYFLGDFTTDFLAHPGLAIDRGHPAAPAAFLAIFFLQAYLDLSAYTDIALGASALFGFRITENFHFPFAQPDIGGFWRSWHISLARWCRDQIFFPVFALTRRPALATYASMLTMGLWHHLSLNWAAWGAYHATGLVAHARWRSWRDRRFGPDPFLPLGIGKAVSVPLTWAFVAVGYAFVAMPGLREAFRLIGAALGGMASP